MFRIAGSKPKNVYFDGVGDEITFGLPISLAMNDRNHSVYVCDCTFNVIR